MDEPLSAAQIQALRDYAAGRLGTREAIERAGLEDYADLIIGLARNGLDFPEPVASPERDARVAPAQRDPAAAAAAMTIGIRIVVTDAAPLIYLAAGKSLDYLLYPRLPVLIPDAVFHEATAASDKLGAQEIIGWYRDNPQIVRVEPTAIFQRETKAMEVLGGRLPRDLGERAALELIRAYPFADDERTLLLSDDRDAERLSIIDPTRLVLMGTWDFLRELEETRRIQSADAIRSAVLAAAISLPTRDLFSRHDPEVRDAVREILKGASD